MDPSSFARLQDDAVLLSAVKKTLLSTIQVSAEDEKVVRTFARRVSLFVRPGFKRIELFHLAKVAVAEQRMSRKLKRQPT